MSRRASGVSITDPHTPVALPLWARLADAAALLLLLTAAIVTLSGGFRMPIGGFRVALTSPYRLIGWALLLTVVRHVLLPRLPIHRHLLDRAVTWWRSENVRLAALVLVGTRPVVLLVGYLAVLTFGYPPRAPQGWFDHELLDLQLRWDAGWYLGIAMNGYQVDSVNPESAQSIVFFPAFPMLIRLGARLLGGSNQAFLAAGTVLVLVAFLGALVYLHRLARDLLPDGDPDEQARAAVWLLAAYPFAVFFSALYTESLFLVSALGVFYHFGRQQFRAAAAWGVVLGLTRPNGCFVAAPLAVMALTPWLPSWLRGGRPLDPSWRALDFRRALGMFAAIAAPVLGLLAYCAFVWTLSGRPFAWVQSQAAWGRRYTGLGALALRQYELLSQRGLHEHVAANPFDFLNALGALFVLVSVVFVFRRLGLAYAVFVLVNMLPPLAMGGFLSAGRFSSVMFPSFIWLGSAIPPRQRTAWFAGFMAIQAFNAALFYAWRALY